MQQDNSMEVQKKRYGEKLYEKNSEGKYRCFFCNKELRANFSRHISRHEADGDVVNEELKHALLHGLPLPAPSSSLYDSNYVPVSQNKRRDAYPTQSPFSTPSPRAFLEQQFFQIVFSLLFQLPATLRYIPLTRKYVALMEEQIVVTRHTQVEQFFRAIKHIGEQLVAVRGSHLQEVQEMKEIQDHLERVYQKELGKSKVEAGRYGQKCSLCAGDPLPNVPLLPCVGDCLRKFHTECAIQATGVHVCQISTLSVGYASWCDDCMQGHKILRWDPQRKQHFFTEFVHPDTPPRPLINIEESQAGSDLRSVNKGAAIELVMVEPPGEDDSQIEIPITMPKNTKKRVHKEEIQHKKEMWYDPFWCVWRYATKEGAKGRLRRQTEQIEQYALSDDSTDTEGTDEPPTKRAKIVEPINQSEPPPVQQNDSTPSL